MMGKKKDNKANKKEMPKPKKAIKSDLSIEIWGIIVIAISILLIISIFFNNGGILGDFLSKNLKGILGIGAYILPITLIVSCICIFLAQNKKINIVKLVLFIVVFVFVISLFHIISKKDTESTSKYTAYLLSKFRTGSFLNGGMFGAIIGDIFLKLMGKVASVIVLIMLSVSCIFLLMGKSFFISLYKIYKDISERFYYENSLEEYEEDEDTYKKPKMKKKYRYIEEDIENEKNIEPTLKKYNGYIYDGIDTYKKVKKATFLDINPSIKNTGKKISFAMDEINNRKKNPFTFKNITIPKYETIQKNTEDKSIDKNVECEDIKYGDDVVLSLIHI